MRHWALSATAAGASILISSSGSASSPQGLISGSYFLDGKRSDNYLQSIDSALPVRSLATRDLVRRLRKAAAPGYAISISFPEGRFSIKIDDKRLIDVSTSGEAIEWKLVDGLIFDVSATANGEAVSLTFRAPDSERTTVYRSDGQQLVAENTITGPLISTPIRYKVVYNRAN